MEFKEYQKETARSESIIADLNGANNQTVNSRGLHGAVGIVTEAGELMNAFKRQMYYGKDLDVVNIEEELGDLFYYFATICTAFDLDLESIMIKNVNKLRARYPEKFDQDKAINRDLEKERKILETEIV